MSEPVKMNENILAEIKMLQAKYHESIYKMGNLHVEKMELDQMVSDFVEKEKKLNEEWRSIQKLEQSLLNKIIQQYGEGNLNLSDGTFIPNSPPKVE